MINIIRDELKQRYDVYFNNKKQLGYIYIENDGFYVYQPTNGGFLNEYSLKLILDKLIELNSTFNNKLKNWENNKLL